MFSPLLRGRAFVRIVYMLLFDAAVLWILFSWQYLRTLFPGGEDWPGAGGGLANAVMVGIAALVSLWATRRIPPTWKDAIVFWRTRNAFPARRAFSQLARNDYRYRPETLQQKTGPFPADPIGQQALWHSLYRKFAYVPIIRQQRTQYQLCYEIAALSLMLLFPMLVLVGIRWSSQSVLLLGPGFLLGQYIMFVVAAHWTANELIKGVMALEAMVGNDPAKPET
jgi:hypothetical protein